MKSQEERAYRSQDVAEKLNMQERCLWVKIISAKRIPNGYWKNS
jgi:hypothetical protein